MKEHRVRYLCFLGIAMDDRFCGYIVDSGEKGGEKCFKFYGFRMEPNTDRLCLALHAACQARYKRVRESASRQQGRQQQPARQEVRIVWLAGWRGLMLYVFRSGWEWGTVPWKVQLLLTAGKVWQPQEEEALSSGNQDICSAVFGPASCGESGWFGHSATSGTGKAPPSLLPSLSPL